MAKPIFQEEPPLLKTGNRFITIKYLRIFSNTVEQTLIFVPIFTYFLINHSKPSDKEFAILVGLQFLAGRVAFALGYLGAIVGISSLRSFGFLLTLSASAIILLRIQFGDEWLSIFNSIIPIPV